MPVLRQQVSIIGMNVQLQLLLSLSISSVQQMIFVMGQDFSIFSFDGSGWESHCSTSGWTIGIQYGLLKSNRRFG